MGCYPVIPIDHLEWIELRPIPVGVCIYGRGANMARNDCRQNITALENSSIHLKLNQTIDTTGYLYSIIPGHTSNQ